MRYGWALLLAAGAAAGAAEEKVQPGGTTVIPVIGVEQAGGSSAESKQKFFFNFFISRPLPVRRGQGDGAGDDASAFGPRWRWWGELRVGSYPQQITTGVSALAGSLTTQVISLKVNELAHAGEFTTGLEYRIASFSRPFTNSAGQGDERVHLGIVAGVGATSPLKPADTLEIYKVPHSGSAQWSRFAQRFPEAIAYSHLAVTTPDTDRLFQRYMAGVRLTTAFCESGRQSGASPAMVTFTVGQNQAVTGGVSRGVVQRVEAFFPLPLGERFGAGTTTLYLFGRVDMRLGAPRQETPLILEPAGGAIAAYNLGVAVAAVRSNRDLYSLGVGIDAIKLLKGLAGGK